MSEVFLAKLSFLIHFFTEPVCDSYSKWHYSFFVEILLKIGLLRYSLD